MKKTRVRSLPKVRLVSATLHRADTSTRMPFRFGIAVMTEAPHVFLHASFEVNRQVVTGIAAEGLLPKWFDKDPNKSAEQELHEMILVIRQAVAFAGEIPPNTAFEFWRQLYAMQMAWASSWHQPPLLANFGVSMVERAMLDALARSQGTTFSRMLRTNLPGIDLGAIHPELAGHSPAEFLPAQPLGRIIVRHTIGLSDPLRAADLASNERLDDGLPQTLEDSIVQYGLQQFKIKLGANVDSDLKRLREIARVITRLCGDSHAFTLDGNEQYQQFDPLVELWERIQADAELAAFFQHVLFIEQPLHRFVALDPEVTKLATWHGPPITIDESDAAIGDFALALEFGYAGTSHKNCKGIIKGVAHRCLVNHRNAIAGAPRLLMSGEDLVNIGPVALLQDLAAQAALGNDTVERNGHHYFRGLAPFPAAVSAAMLARHGDLYTKLDDSGIARVDVRRGDLHIDSVNAAPFGVAAEISMDEFERLPMGELAASA